MKKSVLAVYVAAFFAPPLVIGTLLALWQLSVVLIKKDPAPLASEQIALLKAIEPPQKGRPLKAVIAMPNSGVQISDLFIPYEILSRTGEFDVWVAAPKKELSPTTALLAVIPHVSFEKAPQADLLVIPAALDPSDKDLLRFVRSQAPGAKIVLGLCEGTRVLAAAGLLTSGAAASHFLAIDQLQEAYPALRFRAAPRFVRNGKYITSAGVTASFDATLAATRELLGPARVIRLESQIQYQMIGQNPRPSLEWADFIHLYLRTGYDWVRRNIGVAVGTGVSEISLASALDTFPRSFGARAVTFGETRQPYATAHGLVVVPYLAADRVPRFDTVIIPDGATASAELPKTKRMLFQQTVKLHHFKQPPGASFDHALAILARQEGPAIARFVAKLIESPRWSDLQQSGIPSHLIIRPVLVGLLSMLLVFMLRRWLRSPPLERRSEISSTPNNLPHS